MLVRRRDVGQMIGHERANVRADDLPRELALSVGNGNVIGNTARQNGYEQKRRKGQIKAKGPM